MSKKKVEKKRARAKSSSAQDKGCEVRAALAELREALGEIAIASQALSRVEAAVRDAQVCLKEERR
jgi:hypothetical protein